MREGFPGSRKVLAAALVAGLLGSAGLRAGSPRGRRGDLSRAGMGELIESERPGFRSFRLVDRGGMPVTGGFGMAHRTQAHLVARREDRSRGIVRSLGGVRTDRSLSVAGATPEAKAALVAVMLKDQQDLYRRFEFFRRADDLTDNLLERLAVGGARSLVLCLESRARARRRYLFLHEARQEGPGVWSGRFYDPHAPVSRCTGTLRLDEGVDGRPARLGISEDWAEQADREGDDPFAPEAGPDRGLRWLDACQLGVAELETWFDWEAVDYRPVVGGESDDELRAPARAHLAATVPAAAIPGRELHYAHGAHDQVAGVGPAVD